MEIDKRYLAKILNTRKFYSKLKEIGLFTYDTSREAAFLIVKEPNSNKYEILSLIMNP